NGPDPFPLQRFSAKSCRPQGPLALARRDKAPRSDLARPPVPGRYDGGAMGIRARRLFFESPSRSNLLLEHDLFRKPVPTFRDHALQCRLARVPARCPGVVDEP